MCKTQIALLFIFQSLIGVDVLAQRPGFFVAPQVLAGYSNISPIYHIDDAHAPANKGFNLAFMYGAMGGYKLDHWGILANVGSNHFQQNFEEANLVGHLSTAYVSFGGQIFYQFERLQSSRYYHTAYLGYQLNAPQSADYTVKNEADGTVYNNISALYQLQNDHMLMAAYGITTGHKLLWADFSVRCGYSLGNIYKSLTATKGKNFFLGFSLSFGLFVSTTK